jgi:DNA-binding response OmpR family regulator
VEILDASLSADASGARFDELPAAPSMTVVSLDDDPTIGMLLTSILATIGGQVIAVQRVTDLWSVLERTQPDAILLDLDLPSGDGIDLCKTLRSDARTATTPLIILTATPSGEAVQRAFTAGADDYITKPIVGPELIGRLTARHREAPAGASHDIDVAIVEDDDATAALLQHLLERESLTWQRFSDGDEALVLAKGAVRARVILLDVGLPGLDGFGVLRKLAAAGVLGTSKVVMLTARSSEPEVLRALELGAVDHIEKPFSLPILAHRIKRVLQP